MAQRSSSDTRLNIPPSQISKDLPGLDNPLPLSPQWLLPKPGESKPGIGTVENRVNPISPFGNHSESVKTSGNCGDVHDVQKKKDVFRPSMLDSERGRHDRWRDEERDTKSSTRKDRWRDGDKDFSDARRVDRWTENSSTKNFGEARRSPSDRWNDSGNKETNFDQRRESKWNTGWGSDDKEPEGLCEKWNNSGKDSDVVHEKGLSHLSKNVKDAEEGDHYRPWRPSFSQSRGRAEPTHPPNVTPSKQSSTFSHGRSRRENTPPAFTVGHGRAGSVGGSMNNNTYPGTVLDKVESGHGELCAFRYNRTKLLDVYRLTDMGANRKLVDDVVLVPNITQDEPLEPLSLSVPNSEELSVLEGIEKAEIISSSTPQVSKEGRVSTDFTHTRRMKPQDRSEGGGSYRMTDGLPINRDSSFEGNSSVHPSPSWRATPLGEHTSPLLHHSRDVPRDIRSRKSDKSSHHPKDPHNQWENNLALLSDSKDVSKWQASDGPIIKRNLSGIFDSEQETMRAPQTSPEQLSLFYKDPNGQVQGPFKGIDIIGWFEAGYFGIDLNVRLENSAADSPWLSLGDAMPHLRAKARPPPGFPAPKPNDFIDIPGQQSSSTFGNILPGLSEADILRIDSRHIHSPSTESENRFLASLMSGNKDSPPLDGLQDLVGNNSGSVGPAGIDGGNNLLLIAKRMALERQRSLPNPYPFWPGRDAAALVPKSDIIPDAALHSKNLSSVGGNSRLPQSQNSEMLSVVQGLSDRTSAGINNGIAGWPNYPLQGGLNSLQNNVDIHNDQSFPQGPFGIQQQRLQAQNQLSLNNLSSQATDNPSNMLVSEKLLSSGFSQDPQVLNLLQQQYLLQLHSMAAAPTSQVPLLDKLLLLKQQQMQEQQHQLLWQQQQHLFSQLLQDQQSKQCFGDSSYGPLQGSGISMGNLHADASQLRPPREIFATSLQTPIPTVHDELSSNYLNLPPQDREDLNYNVGSRASVHLPHQLFENTSQKNWGSSLPEKNDETHQKETLSTPTLSECSPLHDENRKEEEPHIVQKPPSVSDFTAKSVAEVPNNSSRYDGTVVTVASQLDENSGHSQHVVPVAVSSAASHGIVLPPVSYLGKDVEIKSDILLEDQQAGRYDLNVEPSDAPNIEPREPKKSTERKSKKQKSSKAQSSNQEKGLLKNVILQQSEAEKPNFSDVKLRDANKDEAVYETYSQQKSKRNQTRVPVTAAADHQEASSLPASLPESIPEKGVASESTKAISSIPKRNTELHTGRAWKPAPGTKPKSLIEIQLEEQKKTVTEMLVSEIATSVNSMNLTSPWAEVVANPESGNISSESQGGGNIEYLIKPKTSEYLKSKKSPLHDLLAEEVLKKFNEKDSEIPDDMSSQVIAVHSESLDDSNFIEAKESKRSRRKSAKSKGSGAKASVPIVSNEVPIASSPVEKGKVSHLLQQEKEVLPAIPAGPSLGDFVLWKGGREAPNPSPSPAWCTDSGRVPKPTSLRDILKEQEKKSSSAVPASPMPAPQKLQPAQANWNSDSSRSISAFSPSKAASPIQINSYASSQSRYKGDDDLFWGPIEQSKPDTKLSDFPQLSSKGSKGSKIGPSNGNSPASLTRQKSAGGKPAEQFLSSSPASSQSMSKSKKDTVTKHSEAIGFREWCENECVRLIGTKDTSFLEFCLKQSKSEAKMLLTENLGSFDPEHEFIDKFLNYMEMLPSDVLEIAFQSKSDQKISGVDAGRMLSANVAAAAAANIHDVEHTEGSSKGGGGGSGGKKKGKKGKKVSPSVLGFNVVSNRIMMGEIQTVED